MSETKFEQWAIVELFGHQRIAGRVTEQTIGGSSFVRVDVPEIPQEAGRAPIPGFTKLFGQSAIYALSFVDEATARLTAASLQVQPIDTWAIERAIGAMNPERVQRLLGVTASEPDDELPY